MLRRHCQRNQTRRMSITSRDTKRKSLARSKRHRRAWCAMSAGGSACAVVSSFGRRTCNACAYAPRNRTGKDAGAGKTTTASEKPCTALFVVSGAVARSPGEAAPSHREPLDVNQTDSVRNGSAPTRATWPSTGAAGTRCRLCGCASVAGGWGDDHHTAAARVLAATVRGL